MSRTVCACMLIGSMILGFCAVCADAVGAQNVPQVQQDHVQVYYFYTSVRCKNCYNMEQWTREVVEKDFKGELDAGKIAFQMVNMEEKANKHFVDEYRLYTKAVLLSVVKSGEELWCENLVKVWGFLNSKEKFQEYVKEAIRKALRDLA